jgi:hypothetical protein
MSVTRRQAVTVGGLGLVGAGTAAIPISSVSVRDHGAKGDWNPYTGTGTDDTAAIRAAIAACPMGGAVFFPGTGPNRKYLISGQIDITTPNIRILGAPRDTYATSVRCNTINTIMFMVKTPGVVFQDIGIEGGGGAITGVEVWGDADGNCDSRFDGVTFMRLLTGVRTRGRNNTFMGECIFSISTEGIVIDGPDSHYHTGTGAYASMWGNTVINCRFHGNGSRVAHGNIRITPAARVLTMQVIDNEFDSGKGTHVIATGDATYPVKNLVCQGNAHSRVGGDVYNFSYVNNSTITGASVAGYTAGYHSGYMYTLANCVFMTLSNGFGLQIGKSGVKATRCSILMIEDIALNTVGLDMSARYHGLDIDSTNTDVHLSNILVSSSPGYGLTGTPAGDSSMNDCKFRTCALGRMNSNLLNRAVSGRNVFIEGSGGRQEDRASKSYDILVASGATTVATVTAATNYTSFEVEVKIIGRNEGGNSYVKAIRYVRPENGNPQYATVGTDTVAGPIAVGFATSGTASVRVTATATSSDAYVTVHVTALAGGGASAGASRGVTVTMA